MKTVGLISLGCAKNRVDAEKILAGFVTRGFEIVEDPAEAEILVVNTCGFINDAVKESVDEIFDAAQYKESGKCKVLAVAGCLYKRYPEMKEELPEVDFFFTPDDIEKIPYAFEPYARALAMPHHRVLTAPPHSAYLKIAEGCANNCSYCTIPLIRGPFRSFDAKKLLDEARELAQMGTVELNLVAQDVTAFGRDTNEARALVQLIENIAKIDQIRWIRLLYAYPDRMPPELLDLFAQKGKLVPYLDAPIQHAHPRILKDMGRRTTPEGLREYFGSLRTRIPDIALRTTAIVGFPGETEDEFEALLDFVEEVRFNHLGAFVYSPEEGTRAAKLPNQVPQEVADERYDRLMELQARISAELNESHVGNETEVLVDGIDEEGEVVGRTPGQAPEVDGITRILDFGDNVVEIGSFAKVKIVGADVYDLSARLL